MMIMDNTAANNNQYAPFPAQQQQPFGGASVVQHYQQQQQQQQPWQHVSPSRTIVSSFTPLKQQLKQSQDAMLGMEVITQQKQPVSSQQQHQHQQQQQTVVDPYEEGDWVLCLATPPTTTTSSTVPHFACALSNGQVHVYDTQRMHLLETLNHHSVHYRHCASNRITDLTYANAPNNSWSPTNTSHSDNILVTCGQDGTVRLFDVRVNSSKGTASNAATDSAVWRGDLPAGQAAFSISLGYEGTIAAVGSTKGRIHFLDLRSSRSSGSHSNHTTVLLGSYRDSHVDDVTTVDFVSRTQLLTGSDGDGLVVEFDTTQPNETDALMNLCRIGAPIRTLGLCSNGYNNNNHTTPSCYNSTSSPKLIYCLTGSETVSVWNLDHSVCVYDSGWNVRHDLTQSLVQAQQQPPQQQPHPSPSLPTLDYLVDAIWDGHELQLLAGDANGNTALFTLQQQQHSQQSQYHWTPRNVFTGGHRGVVRACRPIAPHCLLTAGEDARLCEWNHHHYTTSTMMTTPSPSQLHQPVSAFGQPQQQQQQPWHVPHPTAAVAWTTAAPAAAAAGGGPIRRRTFRPTGRRTHAAAAPY